jgi:3-phosphoshikimate 1-carboxyvinyltransferase
MLKFFKADIKTQGKDILIKGGKELHSPGKIYLPADISSASFFMVLAAILPRSKIVIKKVSLNTSRLGIVRALRGMGADITIISRSFKAAGLEPLGDIKIGSSKLKAIRITKKDIPFLIDELPILMVAACFAKGKSVFEGVTELRVKETDRINSMCFNLRRMGADIKVQGGKAKEIIVIRGARGLKGCSLKSFRDHRTAMSMVVAALAASGKSLLDDASCINKSFPEFLPILKGLLR